MSSVANDVINSRLRESRRVVLKFLNNARPFKLMTLKAVKRECHVFPQGFKLRIIGEVQSMDPTVDKWLLKQPWPAFRLKHDGVYHKKLNENTTMVLFNDYANMPLRWKIGYEIQLPIRPWSSNPTATTLELENLVLKLWHQCMDEQRTYEWHRRQL